ncbi:MAG: extracellular solute-binding protein [Clostridiales bacterium]|nr:extracellular solute-binding protein [Clostridiales bacterium]
MRLHRRLLAPLIALVLAASLLPVSRAAQTDYAARVFIHPGLSSMVVLDGQVYLSEYPETFVRLDPETGTKAPLALAGEGWREAAIGQLLAGDGALYALNHDITRLYPLILSEDTVSLGEAISLPEMSIGWPPSAAISEGRLSILTNNVLTIMPLSGGEPVSHQLDSMTIHIPYGPNRFAAVQKKRVQGVLQSSLVTIDAQSGELTPLATLESGLNVDAMAWMPGSPLVISANTALFTLTEEGKLEKAASLVRGDVFGMAMLDPARALVALDSLIALRTIKPELQPAQARLTVLDPLGRGEDYAAFMLHHGDTELAFPTYTNEPAEERFRRDMLTRSDEIDIYLLKDQNLMATIKQKGFALSLSGNPGLAAFGAELYPAFGNFFTQDGQLYGVPKVAFPSSLAYRPEALADLGLEVPTTWAEYFDLGYQWLTSLADEHPDYYFEPIGYTTTIDTLLPNYLDERALNGQPYTMNTPVLRELLAKYRLVLDALSTERARGGIHLFHLVDVPYPLDTYIELPMAFETGNKPVVGFPPDSFSYFVVNPYSKNHELALQFLTYFVDSMAPHLRMRLLSTMNKPIENPEYQTQKERLESERMEVANSLATAEGALHSELESQLQVLEAQLADLEESRWEVTQAQNDRYRRFTDNLYLNPFNPLPQLQAQYPALFAEIEDNPQFDAGIFLARLDEMIAAMLRENEQ